MTLTFSLHGYAVRFRLDASPSGGLRVIAEIPEGDLLQLEGRNGIGKTLAIRLLQLATGSQPYLERAQSWSTLKANLNPVVITVDNLRDGHELRFELDPDDWRSTPEAPGDWLGRAYLDGNHIDWAQVPAILTVHRIGGDETLGESLAAQVAADAESVRQVERRQEARRRSWGEQIAELRLLTDVPTTFDLARLRESLQRASQQADESDAAVDASQKRLASAKELADLVDRLIALRDEAPRLQKQVKRLAAQEAKHRRDVEELDSSAAEILAKDQQSQDKLAKVDHLVGLQRKRHERRERRRRELAEVSRRAGVTAPVDLPAARHMLAELNQRRSELMGQRQTVDRAGLMLELIDAIEIPIGRGLAARLGEESVAQLPTGPVTVNTFAEGLEVRREALEGIDRAVGDELLEEIANLEARIAAGRELPDAVRLLERAEADLAATSDELTDLLTGFTAGVAGKYEEITQRRAALFDELTRIVEERAQAEADLTSLLSLGDLKEVEAAVTEASSSVDLDADPLDGDTVKAHLAALGLQHEELLGTRRARKEQRSHAQQELSRAIAAIAGAVSQLVEGSQFQWIRQAGLALPSADDDVDSQVQGLTRLGGAVQRLEELMLRTLNDQQALGQALASLERRLRASTTVGLMQPGPEGELSRSVERHYERRFADELSTDMVRHALFSGGTDITVSLEDMTTSWTLVSGQRNTRPLEAFSSGERAFAYTRVQVERRAEDTASNRVIFLDEFGSFVAHDRFEQLKRYLRSQALGRAADKIVVILPFRETPSPEEQLVLDRSGGYLTRDLD